MKWGREREEELGMKGVGVGAVQGRGGVNVKATLLAVNMVITGKVNGGSDNVSGCLIWSVKLKGEIGDY